MHRNTMLCIDLKTFLQSDALPEMAKTYKGSLMRDGEDHLVFLENDRSASETKHNPSIYKGEKLTITVRDNGMLRMNLKQIDPFADFNIDSYALAVCDEIRKGLACLVEKGDIE